MIPKPGDAGLWSHAALSPDGKWLALASNFEIGLVDVIQGRIKAETSFPQRQNLSSLNFSPDSARLVYSDWELGFEYLSVPTLGVALPWIHPSEYNIGGAGYADFSPDGTVDVVSTATGNPVCPPLVHPDATLVQERDEPLKIMGADSIVTGTPNGLFLWDAWSGLQAMEPYPPSGDLLRVFDVDSNGKYAALIAVSGRVTLWPLPPRYEKREVPSWLLRLARALAGKSLDANGNLVAFDAGFEQRQAELAAVQKELDSLPADAPYAEWGRWILADPDTRPIAPGLNITLAEARARGLAD